nr:hypothetical protein [Treponema sp.]
MNNFNDSYIDKVINNPSSRFSPLPFWFWNDDLSKDEILRQMSAFKEKGIDGFVIHPRLGLPESIEYLSDKYFDYVEYAVEKAHEMNMTVVLYDEAMYPSGSCHGEVVKTNPEYASQGLRISDKNDVAEKEKLVASVDTSKGIKYFIQTPSNGTIRGVHYGEDDGEEKAPKSSNLLDKEAVRCFINLTYEKYYSHLSKYFGNTIKAFFTDEPNVLGRCCRTDVIAWTDGLLEEFIANGGKKIDLTFLFDEGDNFAKSIYHKTVYNRLSESYYKQLSSWCASHSIFLTGHPEKSSDIGYLKYFQAPCQDIVWRFVALEDDKYIKGNDSVMGKCSSDSARHRGKERNGNECFGCCGRIEDPFKFTKEDMLWYLNWLFVRGVNLIYPHAFYYSLRGERKNERPPEVGMHSEFWNDYKELSDYIKVMCELNFHAVNQADVAIICSDSLLSWKIARPLFENQIEFNYLEEELLSECNIEDRLCKIAEQKYKVLVYDDSISEEALYKLKAFEMEGVHIFNYSDDESLLHFLNAVDCTRLMTSNKEKDLR